MAFTFIASAVGGDDDAGTTSDTTTSFNVAAGDVLVAWVKSEGAPTTVAVADTGGTNALTFDAGDVENHSNGDLSTAWGYRLIAQANATATFRLTTQSRPFRTLIMWQFRPDAAETITKDASNVSQGSGTTMSSGNISTTGDDEIVLGGYGEYVGNNSANHQINGVAATGVVQASGIIPNFTASWYRILAATFTNGQATCTNNSSDWICGIIAIKSGGAAPAAGTSSPLVPQGVLGSPPLVGGMLAM